MVLEDGNDNRIANSLGFSQRGTLGEDEVSSHGCSEIQASSKVLLCI